MTVLIRQLCARVSRNPMHIFFSLFVTVVHKGLLSLHLILLSACVVLLSSIQIKSLAACLGI